MKRIILSLVFLAINAYADDLQDFEIYQFDNSTIPTVLGKYQKLCNHQTAYVLTSRIDNLTYIRKWELFTRFEIPYRWTHQKDGFSDFLIQAFCNAPPFQNWIFGLGVETLFPTGSKWLSCDKYLVRPMFQIQYLFENLKGSWFAFMTKYQIPIGHHTAYFNVLSLQPTLHFELPHHWFLNFGPEILYNCHTEKWFLPFDALVGNVIHENIILAFEYKQALIRDFPIYILEIEASLGVVF